MPVTENTSLLFSSFHLELVISENNAWYFDQYKANNPLFSNIISSRWLEIFWLLFYKIVDPKQSGPISITTTYNVNITYISGTYLKPKSELGRHCGYWKAYKENIFKTCIFPSFSAELCYYVLCNIYIFWNMLWMDFKHGVIIIFWRLRIIFFSNTFRAVTSHYITTLFFQKKLSRFFNRVVVVLCRRYQKAWLAAVLSNDSFSFLDNAPNYLVGSVIRTGTGALMRYFESITVWTQATKAVRMIKVNDEGHIESPRPPNSKVIALAPPVNRARSLYNRFQMRGANLYRTWKKKKKTEIYFLKAY